MSQDQPFVRIYASSLSSSETSVSAKLTLTIFRAGSSRDCQLTDEIQNTLPLGKRCVDLYIADIHQRRRVNGANIHIGCRICVHAIPPCLGYFIVMTG